MWKKFCEKSFSYKAAPYPLGSAPIALSKALKALQILGFADMLHSRRSPEQKNGGLAMGAALRELGVLVGGLACGAGFMVIALFVTGVIH